MNLIPRPLFGATHGVCVPIFEFADADSTGKEATLLERGDIGCVLVNCAVDASAVAAELGAATACVFALEAGTITDASQRRILWRTPRSWIVQCPVEDEWALAARINDAFPDKRVHATVNTDQICWLELYGAQALSLLREGGFISLEREGLPTGRCKCTRVAGVAAVIVHLHSNTWLVGVERSRAVYFVDCLRAAVSRSTQWTT